MSQPIIYLSIAVTLVVGLDLATVWYLDFGEDFPLVLNTMRILSDSPGTASNASIEYAMVSVVVALCLDIASEWFPEWDEPSLPPGSPVSKTPGNAPYVAESTEPAESRGMDRQSGLAG